MKTFAVVFEAGPSSVGAYVPDLPGCVAVGETLADAERLIREAILFHIQGLVEAHEPVPEPTSHVEYLDIAV